VTKPKGDSKLPFDPQGRRTGSTLSEFAERIRASERTARRHVERGEVEAFLIGGRRLIDDDSIDRFIERCKLAGPQLGPPPGVKRPRGRPRTIKPEQSASAG
jgi:excisionase family DNA binding protein